MKRQQIECVNDVPGDRLKQIVVERSQERNRRHSVLKQPLEILEGMARPVVLVAPLLLVQQAMGDLLPRASAGRAVLRRGLQQGVEGSLGVQAVVHRLRRLPIRLFLARQNLQRLAQASRALP